MMFSLSIINSIVGVITVSTIFLSMLCERVICDLYFKPHPREHYCPTTQCQFDRKGQYILTLMVTAMTATMMMTGSECGRVIAPPMVAPRRVWTSPHIVSPTPALRPPTQRLDQHQPRFLSSASSSLSSPFTVALFRVLILVSSSKTKTTSNTNHNKITHLRNNKRPHLAVI